MNHDDKLALALRTLLELNTGLHISYSFDLLSIGQFANLNYWVSSLDHHGKTIWEIDDVDLKTAIAHFLRLRRERQLGFDLELS